MKQPEDFPHPLDTDIVEQVPVKKVSVEADKDGNITTSIKTIMEKQTVRYIHAPKEKFRCNDGDHVFRVFNMKKYMFACVKCPFVRKVYPSTYRFEESTGKLIHLETGQAV